ncbi:amidohydrolase 2 [Aspergillus sclerotiicarbonarius CBS 121057]|uniref:6-methylsalicylate decarboxylase n=1 Tax=Aspergillus sclerotiicarbonarius (strain CBS 121057 / IBT 28362) TaxID=1448318 RepID=A0A319F730_ASPSB|nr:amidohydrolase 2 [Aspergillus sclerotiicarbonarius CBS 121057]
MPPLKIDTHQHVFPPLLKKAIEGNPKLSQGFIGPEWSPSTTLEFMTRNDIGTSILSCAIPLNMICQNDTNETAALTRAVNDYLASLRDQYLKQFGFFAALPSPEDATRCIEEIRYALGTLKADGVTFFTSYNGKYLGHPDFQPVWAELNSHAAIVFTHPTMEGMEKSITDPFVIPRALIDWSHETTRTAVHLIMTNTLRRFAACRVILSHGGGTLPFVASRIADIEIQTRLSGKSPGEFLEDAKSFYYDVALVGSTPPLQLLRDFAPPDHLLYGSDYPFVREHAVVQKWQAVGDEDLVRSTRKTAQTLFPRLADPVD